MDSTPHTRSRFVDINDDPTPVFRTARNVAWIFLISVAIIVVIQFLSHNNATSTKEPVEKKVGHTTWIVITGTTSWYHPKPELTWYELEITVNSEQQVRVMILDATLQKRRKELVSMLKDIDANVDMNNKQLVTLRARLAEINTTNYYTGDSFQ